MTSTIRLTLGKNRGSVLVPEEGNYADKKGLIEKATVVEGKVQSTEGDNKGQINDNLVYYGF